jgi:hypothetical protein
MSYLACCYHGLIADVVLIVPYILFCSVKILSRMTKKHFLCTLPCAVFFSMKGKPSYNNRNTYLDLSFSISFLNPLISNVNIDLHTIVEST